MNHGTGMVAGADIILTGVAMAVAIMPAGVDIMEVAITMAVIGEEMVVNACMEGKTLPEPADQVQSDTVEAGVLL